MAIGVANQILADNDQRIEMARSLIAHLEAGDDEKANNVIDQLGNIRESQLFKEVGQLTRELHTSLSDCYDDNISALANKEMPNARERLKYVIEKTEESANRTLNAIEESVPISEELQSSATQMTEDWERFKRREMNAEDFRELAKKLSVFLDSVNTNSNKIHTNINEILMAQEYQDLTGQMINQVIDIVESVEGNLVRLIKCAGFGECEAEETGPDIKAEGPQLNTADSSKVVSGQDDVDELLSSLGF